MKFVLAPDKFKGSLTGFEFCEAVESGLRKVFPNADILQNPLADGGDGTIEVVKYYLQAETIALQVNDPLFRPLKASYLFSPSSGIAYIEMAEASGLKLLTDAEKNCMLTTTLGTGEIIRHALDKGATEIILGIGGSATNDAGMGMATALGFEFLDANDKPLQAIGKNLGAVKKIDTQSVDPRLKDIQVKVACDVTNPLYGKDGAAWVYAAQKGADKKEMAMLDAGLKNIAAIIQQQFGIDLQQIPGSGAAGGMGAAALTFLNAKLTSGNQLIKDIADFDRNIKGADWIITGEGKLDDQTLSGKTIQGVLESANRQGIPVAAFCGIVEASQVTIEQLGLAYVVSVSEHMPSMQEAIRHSYRNVEAAATTFAHSL